MSLLNSLRALTLGSLLTVAVQAQQQCSSQIVGTSCGPTLTATFQPIGGHHQMNLLVGNAFPSSPGMWVFGVQELNLPIPGTACFLYTNFIYGHPFVSRADGTELLVHSWPLAYNGVYMWVQVASMDRDTAELRTTNGVFVTCQ